MLREYLYCYNRFLKDDKAKEKNKFQGSNHHQKRTAEEAVKYKAKARALRNKKRKLKRT